MNKIFSSAVPAAMLGACLAACVGSGGIQADLNSAVQQVEVHAILDHREIAGAGCLLENDAGRWFVLAPGRVTVTRSSRPLAISCKREGVAGADETWQAHHQSGPLAGEILSRAGLRDYLPNSYAYASVLTVTMRPAGPGAGNAAADPGTPLF